MSRYLRLVAVLCLAWAMTPGERVQASSIPTVSICGRDVAVTSTTFGCYAYWGYSPESLRNLSELRQLRELSLGGGARIEHVPPDAANRVEVLRVQLTPEVRRWKVPALANLETVDIQVEQNTLVELDDLGNSLRLQQVEARGGLMRGIEAMQQIVDLQLADTELVDSKAINQLARLVTLSLQRVHNVAPIAGLSRLRELEVLECDPEIIDQIGGLLELRKLSIRGIESLPHLGALRYLRVLDLRGNDHLQDVPGLAQLHSLEELSLGDTGIISIDPLAGLHFLTDVNLAGTKITSIDALSDLRWLVNLDLQRTPLSNLGPLRQLFHLRSLRLTSIRGPVDLSPLSRLVNLEVLEIGGVKAKSWRPVARLKRLRKLDLSSTNFVDTRLLARLSSLESLNLRANPELRRLRGFHKLGSLVSLDIDETGVTQLAPLEELPALRSVTANTEELRKKHGSCASFKLGKAWVTVQDCDPGC